MLVKQPSVVSKNYLDYIKEQEMVEKEIWSSIEVKGLMVIDFGVGESTKKLVELGARVIAVDKDKEKLKRYSSLDLSLIQCDIVKLPFHTKIADLAVFYFTLHEIDPNLHKNAILSARKVSSKVMVVEPSPNGCPTYNLYASIWRRAMHSINEFEDYKHASYWKRLIEDCGFKVIALKMVRQKVEIPFIMLKQLVHDTIKQWKNIGIKVKYIREMENFLNYVKKRGMRWSDLSVIIGI